MFLRESIHFSRDFNVQVQSVKHGEPHLISHSQWHTLNKSLSSFEYKLKGCIDYYSAASLIKSKE